MSVKFFIQIPSVRVFINNNNNNNNNNKKVNNQMMMEEDKDFFNPCPAE